MLAGKQLHAGDLKENLCKAVCFLGGCLPYI